MTVIAQHTPLFAASIPAPGSTGPSGVAAVLGWERAEPPWWHPILCPLGFHRGESFARTLTPADRCRTVYVTARQEASRVFDDVGPRWSHWPLDEGATS